MSEPDFRSGARDPFDRKMRQQLRQQQLNMATWQQRLQQEEQKAQQFSQQLQLQQQQFLQQQKTRMQQEVDQRLQREREERNLMIEQYRHRQQQKRQPAYVPPRPRDLYTEADELVNNLSQSRIANLNWREEQLKQQADKLNQLRALEYKYVTERLRRGVI